MASSINTDFTQANNHNHNHNHNQPDINLTALSRSSSSSTASSSVLPPLPDLPNSLVSAPLQPTPSSTSSRPTSQHSHTHSPSSSLNRSHKRRFSSLTVAQDRAASENVAPFINKHSPHTLNPGTGIGALSTVMSSKPMYCNRHRPEFKCWRQANEPTMEELQTKLSRMDNTDQQGISHVWSLFSAAPSNQRELMLQGILAVCCFPQLSFISAQVRELIKIDFISALPVEISFKVLSYLDTVSLCKATQVSRTWNQLAEDDVVWHRMCEQHIAKKCKKCGWGLPLLDHHRLKAEKKIIERRALGLETDQNMQAHNVVPEEGSTECPAQESYKRPAEDLEERSPKRQRVPSDSKPLTVRPWKDVYRDRFKVGTNWKYGRYTLKVLKGHENGVMCIQMHGKILASGSYDGTIKIWDLETGLIIRTLVGHTSGIRCLQFSGKQLFSGGMDRTLRIWDWQAEKNHLLKTLEGPMGDVLGLHYDSPYLACGGKDNMIRIWNYQTSKTSLLRGHKDFVNSVRVDPISETIFSAADDNSICLWDIRSGRILKTLEGHAGGVQQITILPPQFELDESDLLDCEHPISDTEQDREEDVGDERVHNVTAPVECGAPMFSTARIGRSPAPETLPNTSPYPDTPENQNRPLPPTYIMTASLDNTLRLWHVPTGRCLRTFFGHVEGVWAIAADNLRVASGSQDRTVKIWDARTGKCERTYSGHVGPVTCVALSGDRLVTGSEDCEIRVMEFGPP